MKPDVYANTEVYTLYHESRATQGSESRTTQDWNSGGGIDVSGFHGRAMAYAVIKADASAAAADSVTVTIQKCSDASGTGAATLQAGTAAAGTGVAQNTSDTIAVQLESLDSDEGYLQASVAYVDDNSSGSYEVCVVLILQGYFDNPIHT